MNAVDTALKVFELIEAKDTQAAMDLLTDDFTFSGPVPEPINGQQWLGLQSKLSDAFPDFSFNLQEGAHQHGDAVHCVVKLSGTHEAELDLSPMGMPVVPATGKSFQLPEEAMFVTVVGDKISSVKSDPVPGGGVKGILSQLGVEPPA